MAKTKKKNASTQTDPDTDPNIETNPLAGAVNTVIASTSAQAQVQAAQAQAQAALAPIMVFISSLQDQYPHQDDYEDPDDPDYYPGMPELQALVPKQKEKEKRYREKEENTYYDKLPKKVKQIINDTEKEIDNLNLVTVPMRFKILESNMDMKLKAHAIGKLQQLNAMNGNSDEYHKMYNYIDNMCKIPIGNFKKMNINSNNSLPEISTFLNTTRQKLDDTVYGHNEAKDQVIRLLAKWMSNPNAGGLVIGIQGPMGCGKTTLCKDGICKALGLPFGFITLGGINDVTDLNGFGYTYTGARWGKIIDILMKTGCMNPVLFFDELDKISDTKRGEEVVHMLIHLTDSSQNDKFSDKYFSDIDLDLSKALIVFSYNNEEKINPILKDRMITIKTNGYNVKDKLAITNDYLLKEICANYGFSTGDIVFTNDVLTYIINITDEEKGVRNLKRSLEEIISQLNLHKLLKKPIGKNSEPPTFPFHITDKDVDIFIAKKKQESPAAFMYV